MLLECSVSSWKLDKLIMHDDKTVIELKLPGRSVCRFDLGNYSSYRGDSVKFLRTCNLGISIPK